MKKSLFFLSVLFLFAVVNINSAHCKANDVTSGTPVTFELKDSPNLFVVEITAEANGLTSFNWNVTNTSYGGSLSIEIPDEVENREAYIAHYISDLYPGIWTIIVEDDDD